MNKEKEIGKTEKTVEAEEIIERPYTLRDLKDKDLFPLLNICKKIGIRDFKEAFVQKVNLQDLKKDEKDESVDSKEELSEKLKDIGTLVAVDMVAILVDNLTKVEDDVYALWADISGIPVDKIKEMEFGTLPLMIIDTFSKAGNASFFKVLSKFLQ